MAEPTGQDEGLDQATTEVISWLYEVLEKRNSDDRGMFVSYNDMTKRSKASKSLWVTRLGPGRKYMTFLGTIIINKRQLHHVDRVTDARVKVEQQCAGMTGILRTMFIDTKKREWVLVNLGLQDGRVIEKPDKKDIIGREIEESELKEAMRQLIHDNMATILPNAPPEDLEDQERTPVDPLVQQPIRPQIWSIGPLFQDLDDGHWYRWLYLETGETEKHSFPSPPPEPLLEGGEPWPGANGSWPGPDEQGMGG